MLIFHKIKAIIPNTVNKTRFCEKNYISLYLSIVKNHCYIYTFCRRKLSGDVQYV